MFFISENDKTMDIESINRIISEECTTFVVTPKQILPEKKVECVAPYKTKKKEKRLIITVKCKKSKYSIS
jgi:hypothetical protein